MDVDEIAWSARHQLEQNQVLRRHEFHSEPVNLGHDVPVDHFPLESRLCEEDVGIDTTAFEEQPHFDKRHAPDRVDPSPRELFRDRVATALDGREQIVEPLPGDGEREVDVVGRPRDPMGPDGDPPHDGVR